MTRPTKPAFSAIEIRMINTIAALQAEPAKCWHVKRPWGLLHPAKVVHRLPGGVVLVGRWAWQIVTAYGVTPFLALQ